jgi:hypothetical protein
MGGVVGRMPLSVENNELAKIKGRKPLETSSVHSQLVGVRAALVVSVDAADGAEMMLGGFCVEAISRKKVIASSDSEISWP